MALLTQNREASARGSWAFMAWLLLKGQWFCTIMWVKQYLTITQITINRWYKPSQMGGLCLFYPHYMIMTFETLTRAWLMRSKKKPQDPGSHWLWWMSARAPRRSGRCKSGAHRPRIRCSWNFPSECRAPRSWANGLEDLPGRFAWQPGKEPRKMWMNLLKMAGNGCGIYNDMVTINKKKHCMGFLLQIVCTFYPCLE